MANKLLFCGSLAITKIFYLVKKMNSEVDKLNNV